VVRGGETDIPGINGPISGGCDGPPIGFRVQTGAGPPQSATLRDPPGPFELREVLLGSP
jgi:hypothetical protein